MNEEQVPAWLRALLLALLIAVSVIILFQFVFPWVETRWYQPTLGAALARW